MYKILVTGFEPFGCHTENSSWAVAEKVSALGMPGVSVEKMPVSFLRVSEALHKAIEKHNPEIIIMLGQSTITNCIKLERVALNMMDSVNGDNDRYRPDEEPIYTGENNALFTTLPIKNLHRAIAEKNISVKISNSCGLYVCNRLYYEALKTCLNSSMQAIFVHLPLHEGHPSADSNTPKMPLDVMTKAILTIINEINGPSKEL